MSDELGRAREALEKGAESAREALEKRGLSTRENQAYWQRQAVEALELGRRQAETLAAVASASALERIAAATEFQAALAQHYAAEHEEFDPNELQFRPAAEVRSSLLMDVEHGSDDGRTERITVELVEGRAGPSIIMTEENSRGGLVWQRGLSIDDARTLYRGLVQALGHVR